MVSIIGSNKRCVIIVNRRIRSICLSIYRMLNISTKSDNRIGGSSTSTTRGGGPLVRMIGVIVTTVTPLVGLVYTTNVVGNVLSVTILYKLPSSDNCCRLFGTVNSTVFCFVPVLLNVGLTGGFTVSPIFKFLMKTTVLCPAVRNMSLGLFNVAIGTACASAFLPIIFAVTVTVPLCG